MLTQDEIDDWYFGNDAPKPAKEPADHKNPARETMKRFPNIMKALAERD